MRRVMNRARQTPSTRARTSLRYATDTPRDPTSPHSRAPHAGLRWRARTPSPPPGRRLPACRLRGPTPERDRREEPRAAGGW
eukprot:13320607-Alexandrium_andersonii.AAC.1